MDKMVEERIRGLAQPLWESAARPYGMAMDFWLMAEQMVLEMMATTARMHNKAMSAPPPAPELLGGLPEAAPVARVRELAWCMWESAGRQYGMAQDFWLAAEQHVLAMLRAASVPAGSGGRVADELIGLPPSAYLDRIRHLAYFSWESAGRQYGEALDYWLQAEREVLGVMAASTGRGREAAEPAQHPAVAVDAAAQPDSIAAPPAPVVEAAVATAAPVSEPPASAAPTSEAAAVAAAPVTETASKRKRSGNGRAKPAASTPGE